MPALLFKKICFVLMLSVQGLGEVGGNVQAIRKSIYNTQIKACKINSKYFYMYTTATLIPIPVS